MKSISAFLFALAFIISCLNSDALGWSWRDLKIGFTTEEELLKNGGTPWEVKLLFPEYLNLKRRKPYSVSFTYYDSKEHRDRFSLSESHRKSLWYDPSKIPILVTDPLQLSDEIIDTEFGALFIGNKLTSYSYTFRFGYLVDKIDTTKYIEMFNSLLRKPVSIRDISWIEYEGCYVLGIFPDSKRIMFQCVPGK